jgi:phospholipid/cholesterol/gamma-HCH transport system substrate-binding protein
MNTIFNTTRIGLFFILGVALIYAVFSTLGNKRFDNDSGYEIQAVFNDLSTISVDDSVRMAGVEIGRVKHTGLKDGQGIATLLIQDQYNEIPKDSVAEIAISSLLGNNYISIKYGNPNSGVLASGDAVTTKPITTINEIMDQIGALGNKLNKIADNFSSLGGEGEDNLFQNLNNLVKDNQSKIGSIVDNLDMVTNQLASTEGTIGKLINSSEAYDELLATVGDIQSFAAEAHSTLNDTHQLINKIQNGEGTLGILLNDEEIGMQIKNTMANFEDFSKKLNSGQGTLGKLVNDDTLYIELRGMMNKAEQALDSMGDSGPISALSTAGTALF